MQITVTSRHVEVPAEVKEYAHEKGEKLHRFFDRIQAINFIMDNEGDLFSVELIVNAGAKHEFVSKEIGDDSYKLIDATLDKVVRQLRDYKEKLKDHKKPKPEATE